MARHPNNNYRRSKGFRRQHQKRNRDNRSFVGQVIGLSLFAAAMTWALAPHLERAWSQMRMPLDELAAVERSVYYQNCDAARAAGAAPIYRGQPGYREGWTAISMVLLVNLIMADEGTLKLARHIQASSGAFRRRRKRGSAPNASHPIVLLRCRKINKRKEGAAPAAPS